MKQLAPTYTGLESVFDQHLVAHHFDEPRIRQEVVAHLKSDWFDPKSPAAYFKDVDVARIYAEGVLKALELSLSDQSVIPIDAWWIVDFPTVKTLVMTDAGPKDLTANSRVTFLIMTPRPHTEAPVTQNPILGSAEAWVSEQQGSDVTIRRVRDLK